MAQDLFFIPLDAEADIGFDRALVTGILSRGATDPVVDYVCVYPDGSRGEAHSIDPDTTRERLDHLGFTHFGGRTMMERIFELADALPVFLAWSDIGVDEPTACVTRPERLARIGEDAKAALTFAVARDASHLNFLVRASRSIKTPNLMRAAKHPRPALPHSTQRPTIDAANAKTPNLSRAN